MALSFTERDTGDSDNVSTLPSENQRPTDNHDIIDRLQVSTKKLQQGTSSPWNTPSSQVAKCKKVAWSIQSGQKHQI